MQYYEFTKHITPLPAGEGLGVGLCVLSTSYKAYYSPPYGGGALWGFVGDVMGFVGLWLCFSYYLAITLIVTFGRPGSFVIISTRGCERADLISRCSAVIFIFADSPGCNFCLFSETCKPTVNI